MNNVINGDAFTELEKVGRGRLKGANKLSSGHIKFAVLARYPGGDGCLGLEAEVKAGATHRDAISLLMTVRAE